MKILRVLYPRSASESTMFTLAAELEKLGHHVAWFAGDDPRNQTLPDAFVVTRPRPGEESAFRAHRRLQYDKDVFRSMQERIGYDPPDVALIWQVSRSLTWAAVDALCRAGIPTWVMCTDYMPLCPARTCTLDGRDCVRCLTKQQLTPCIQNLCLDNDFRRSWAGVREIKSLHRKGHYNQPRGYLSPSDYHTELLTASNFTQQPIRTVDLPLPLAAFAPTRSSRGQYLLYAGSLSERKGLFTLLRSLDKCVCGYPLAVCGDGPDLKKARALTERLRLSHRVRFLGQLPAATLRQRMADCLCVIVPSQCEEIAPWALLEAQALGKPVIASNRGVLPCRVTDGETGYLFPEGDDIALAQCIDLVNDLPEEEYYRMGLAAQQAALKRYHPAAYA